MVSESEENKEDDENQGFKVRDRRRFDAEGKTRESAPEAETQGASQASEPSPEPESSKPAPEAPPAGGPGESLPADFPTLILSLAASAQAGLGIAPNPVTGKAEKNLLQAKHAIDLLGVLEEKTKGNLSQEEAQLMEAILYELRMRYVEINEG